MYKNIKVLRKNEFLKTKFSKAGLNDKLEVSKLIPLGVGEVFEYASSAPIIIGGGEDENEFILFSGLSNEKNIFTQFNHMVEPRFLENYPFMMLHAKNENDEDISVIGIDADETYVGEDKEFTIFDDNAEVSELANETIENVKRLAKERAISKKIIKELKDNDLLAKQTFNINVNGETKSILSDYYIVDRRKLNNIDNNLLALWTKKGWMGIIDAHIYSLRNFEKVVNLLK